MAAHSVNLPKSNSTCSISIIDTTCDITVPPHYLIQPDIPGHDWLNLPTFAFHITHLRSNKTLLFDFGCKKDWQNSVPHIAELAGSHVPGLRVKSDVGDILEAGGVQLDSLSGLILSHWHFDHCGDLDKLPPSVDLLVGPGFRDEFLPGYPAKQSSPFWESAFQDRKVIEVPFDDDFKVGAYQANDYFGDGSLYILNVPGHAVGHVSALVRTTPDTAVFLGGDVCHFTGALRPSSYVHLPDRLPDDAVVESHIPASCPCAAFTACHPDAKNSKTTAFYEVSRDPASFYVDPPTAMHSIGKLAEFDADPNILVLIAHDVAPNKGCKGKMHWTFLNELPYEGKSHMPVLVDGLYNDQGVRIRDLQHQPV